MSSTPRALRDHADALRRAADRFTLLRLQVASALLEIARSSDEKDRSAQELRERWTTREDAELGRIATGLRAGAKQLDEQALALERSSGRRMGGYGGAGFLGRGDQARHHVDEVARFVGTQHGAMIGGFPLADAEGPAQERPLHPGAQPIAFLPHPSHTLGEATPDYDEDL